MFRATTSSRTFKRRLNKRSLLDSGKVKDIQSKRAMRK